MKRSIPSGRCAVVQTRLSFVNSLITDGTKSEIGGLYKGHQIRHYAFIRASHSLSPLLSFAPLSPLYGRVQASQEGNFCSTDYTAEPHQPVVTKVRETARFRMVADQTFPAIWEEVVCLV